MLVITYITIMDISNTVLKHLGTHCQTQENQPLQIVSLIQYSNLLLLVENGILGRTILATWPGDQGGGSQFYF